MALKGDSYRLKNRDLGRIPAASHYERRQRVHFAERCTQDRLPVLRNRPDGADLVIISLVDLAPAAAEPDEDLFAPMAAHRPYRATPLR